MQGLLMLALALQGRAFAAKVHQSELTLTVGFLKSEMQKPITTRPATSQPAEPMPTILSKHFEEVRVATSSEVHNEWINECLRPHPSLPQGELFYFEPDEQWSFKNAHRQLEDEDKSRLLTVWSDCGFESSKQVIVVWRKKGNELRSETVLDHAITASIGRAFLGEIHRIAKGHHILIGRSEGGDDEAHWSTVWAALWTEPREFKIVYSADSDDSAIEYTYDPQTMRLHLSKVAGAKKFEQSDVSLRELIGSH